jgi:hypothetical protein
MRNLMDPKKLGNKFTCFKCSCKFYDLRRPQPICPKCGADQNEAPKKATQELARYTPSPSSRSRMRKKIEEDFIEQEPLDTHEEEDVIKELENGFSILHDDENDEEFGIDEEED